METVSGPNTAQQYDDIMAQCLDIFSKKTEDYGTAWRVLRPISITDQIYIKALRIRTVQENGHQKIDDDISGEFIGIINYAIIGNIQLALPPNAPEELEAADAIDKYKQQAQIAKELMLAKNHDYGEAWRAMSIESFVDLILMKLQRVRQIIANGGKTNISEGLDANYFDMLNYAVFALIKTSEKGV